MERIRLEIKRQPFHILLGLLLITLISYDLLTPLVLLVITVIASFVSFLFKKTKPKAVYNVLRFVEREDALEYFPGKGLVAYLIGTLLALAVFDKDIVLASVMILALGDSFSRLIGPFGRIRHPFNNTKFLEGIIIGIVAASLGAMLFVKPYEAIIASIFAMLLEGINLKLFKFKIDDNFTIPIVAAVVIFVLRLLI